VGGGRGRGAPEMGRQSSCDSPSVCLGVPEELRKSQNWYTLTGFEGQGLYIGLTNVSGLY